MSLAGIAGLLADRTRAVFCRALRITPAGVRAPRERLGADVARRPAPGAAAAAAGPSAAHSSAGRGVRST